MFILESECVKCGKVFQTKAYNKDAIPYHWCFSCFSKWNDIYHDKEKRIEFCITNDKYSFIDSDEE